MTEEPEDMKLDDPNTLDIGNDFQGDIDPNPMEPEQEEKIDIQETINELKKLKEEYKDIDRKVSGYLRELRYKV